MKTKLKIIIVSSLATTVFWCLVVVVALVWFGSEQTSGVSLIEDARKRGFVAMMRAANVESQPVTFVVEELRTNATGAAASQAVLLERELTPSAEFWVGIRKTKTEIK
jgi:flagellar basal body-associated protein FliL